MAYATQSDLVPVRLTLDQLTKLTTEAGALAPNPVVVQDALDKASAVVDSYCGQRYTLPLNASTLARELTADIATYRLYLRRNQVGENTAQSLAYAQAMALLKDVSAGRASLDVAPNAQPQQGSGEVVVTQQPQVFGGSNCEGWL